MAIGLVAFDLDGTILEGGVIEPECVRAIAALDRAGIRCVINSGRSVDFQLELLVESGLVRHFTALIGDERWIHLLDAEGGLTSLEPWNSEVRDTWAGLEAAAFDWGRRLQDQARAWDWPVQPSTPEDSTRRGLWALTAGQADRARDLAYWLEPQLGNGQLACNANGSTVHIYDRARDKGTSLLALTQHLGIRAEDVLAFGDNFNDRPMLDGRYGFAAATVANADEPVKEWVLATGGPVSELNSGRGVARLLADRFPELDLAPVH